MILAGGLAGAVVGALTGTLVDGGGACSTALVSGTPVAATDALVSSTTGSTTSPASVTPADSNGLSSLASTSPVAAFCTSTRPTLPSASGSKMTRSAIAGQPLSA